MTAETKRATMAWERGLVFRGGAPEGPEVVIDGDNAEGPGPMLTLVAFLTGSPLLQPMAWATTAIAVYAIWDYYRVAPAAERRVGDTDG